MTIRLKIIAAVAGTVAVVVAAAAFSWLSLERAMGSLEVERAAEAAIASAYRLEATGRAAMTATGGFKETAALWAAASADCDAAINRFLTDAPSLLDAARRQDAFRKKTAKADESAATGAEPEPAQPEADAVPGAEAAAAVAEKWTKVKAGYADIGGLYEKLGTSRARILVNSLGLQAAYERFSSDLGSFYEEAQLTGAILERYQNAVMFTANITKDLSSLSSTIAVGAAASTTRAKAVGISSLGAAVVAALVISYLFGSSLGRRIGRIESVMRSVAAKDLGARADDRSPDELGRLAGHVNAVLDIIRDFIERARGAAVSLGSVEVRLGEAVSTAGDSSGAVASSAESASSGASTLDRDIGASLGAVKEVAAKVCSFGELADSQASELARISSAVEEMAASMASVARLTQDRLASAGRLGSDVASGAKEAESSAQSLALAERELSRITEISTMIADIADRTSILSMNAAIESAHAGNAGRGFAVVAQEIRKLSDSTAENASGIDGVVTSIARTIRVAVEASARSQSALAGTRESVEAFVLALREITTAVSELSAAVREIRDSVDTIASAARTIHGDAEIAASDSGDIGHDLESVVSSSRSLVGRMAEIRSGVSDLFALMEGLSALARETGERSVDLDTMLGEFSISDEQKNKEHHDA